jgi:hypothetical protein
MLVAGGGGGGKTKQAMSAHHQARTIPFKKVCECIPSRGNDFDRAKRNVPSGDEVVPDAANVEFGKLKLAGRGGGGREAKGSSRI